ncbi:MAG: hypothetical protein MJZ72_01320 [Bacteroidales bacterium]|nr:hypothetical protein [Bacteroidales bacterium]
MQRKNLFLILLAVVFLVAGCAPKIVGKRKHKKIRNCGCEHLQQNQAAADSCMVLSDSFLY